MDSTQVLVAVFGVLGSSGALVVIINGAIKYFNGTAGREKLRNADMKTQRNEAWADAERERDRADTEQVRADREARNRRLTEEYASKLRRDCMEHGAASNELRPWPKLEKD